jgi:acyl-coenzyme A synthetase/AMP-(fatty) acid ligase
MSGYSGPLPPEGFNMARYCLEASARSFPDKLALVVATDPADRGSDECWTYRALEEAVRRVGGGLRARGLERGDRILVRMRNTSDYALVYFGAIAAGLVPIPASEQLSAREIAFFLEDSGARAIAWSEGLALPVIPDGVDRIGPGDIATLKAWPAATYADTSRDDPAYLVYTSGTSGRPKGALHAHRAVWGRRPMYQGWYGIGPGDVMVHAGAFNWTYTLGVGISDPWANGATTVLYTGPRDIAVWSRLIDAYSGTIFAAVPTVYRQILKYCDINPKTMPSLRHGLVAGEALAPAVDAEWRERTGRVLYEALGMTEVSTYISCSPSVPIRPGSPGRPQEGRCVAILPIGGGTEPLAPGEVGLLAVHRSDPAMMIGYWNRPAETAEVFRGNWFCGGDLARMDEDGYVWFEGRNDDLMNAMGYRVSPLEVETVLASHPGVAECAVAEVHVREDVSVIAAFVVPTPGPDLTADALRAHAAGTLAQYKCPREVYFVDALPRTANGKLYRRGLAALAVPVP